MAQSDNVYSQVVFWLKITLPLVALVILSTLFLFSRKVGVDGQLPYTKADVEAIIRDQRLTAPDYTSVTTDGAALRVVAKTAWPKNETGGSTADDVVAAYDTPGGLRIDLTSARGVLNQGTGRMLLSGGVVIVTSSGYRMVTAGLDGALDRTELLSDGRVDAEAPYGTIEAGSMEISHSGDENAGYLLVFKNGVKLIYDPMR
jgi:lipopolysaccharide export system protein LptC